MNPYNYQNWRYKGKKIGEACKNHTECRSDCCIPNTQYRNYASDIYKNLLKRTTYSRSPTTYYRPYALPESSVVYIYQGVYSYKKVNGKHILYRYNPKSTTKICMPKQDKVYILR